MLVLVEGDSDAGAVFALAELIDCDLSLAGIEVRAAAGVTNFPKVLTEFVQTHPGAAVCGMYDAADERHVRRALVKAGIPIKTDEPLKSFDFFACETDLEDELIRALGVDAVVEVLKTQGELESFTRFRAMPQHRASPTHAQLHRFLGTRATRKIRSAPLLTRRLAQARLPAPLAQLAKTLQDAASRARSVTAGP